MTDEAVWTMRQSRYIAVPQVCRQRMKTDAAPHGDRYQGTDNKARCVPLRRDSVPVRKRAMAQAVELAAG
jgi:hypothetical protein